MIHYFFEETESFTIDPQVTLWLENLISAEGKKAGKIQYIFCDDEYLLNINREYLQHDYYTDVITFDYVKGNKISGDIFVSLPRIKDNALQLSTAEPVEFRRVLAHGILHLCGYKDKTEEQQALMTVKENYYLDQFSK